MKLAKYISVLSLSLLFFTSCESDLDKVTYNKAEATSSVLSGLAESYVLDKTKGSENVFTLTWTKPDMTYQASVTNTLQMDLMDNNFGDNKIDLTSSNTDTEYAITVNDLNSKIMSLLEKNSIDFTEGQTVSLSFRIASSISSSAEPLYSETVSTIVTPYEGEAVYPSLDIVGINGDWNFSSSQKVYSINSDDNYAAMVYFGFNGTASTWKIANGSWDSDKNWGDTSEGAIPSESAEATLTAGAGNIKSYSKNSYYVEFNTTTRVLKMSQGHNSWGVIGVKGDWNNDIAMTLASEGDNENKQWYLTAQVEMNDNDTWKIRPDNAWADQKNSDNIAIEGDAKVAGADQNFQVTAGAGTYTIKWYFNKAEQKITVAKN